MYSDKIEEKIKSSSCIKWVIEDVKNRRGEGWGVKLDKTLIRLSFPSNSRCRLPSLALAGVVERYWDGAQKMSNDFDGTIGIKKRIGISWRKNFVPWQSKICSREEWHGRKN